MEEFVAFNDPVLMQSTAMANEAASEDNEDGGGAAEGTAREVDELPQYRITGFTFYNREAQDAGAALLPRPHRERPRSYSPDTSSL